MKRVLFSIGFLVLVLFLVSCGGPKSPNEKDPEGKSEPLTANGNQTEKYVASAGNRETTPTTSSNSEKGESLENTERKQALEAASIFQPDITGSFTFEPAAQEVNGWIVTGPQVTIRYTSSGEPVSVEFYAAGLGTDAPPELIGRDEDPHDGWSVRWTVRDGYWAVWAEEIDKNNDRKRSQPLPVKNAGFRLGTSQEKGPDNHLESIVGTSEDIKAILSQRKDAYAVTWSPDGTVVAFVVGDTQGMEGQMYLWFSGDQRPKLISGITDRICDFYWSPDSQYVFVDTGTSAQRGGIIVSVEQQKEIGRIGYTHRPQWSPDSKMVALGVVRKVEPPMPWELDGTIDLVLYNVETGEVNVVATGTNEVYYYPVKWDSDGTLTYEKHFINNEKVERLKYKK